MASKTNKYLINDQIRFGQVRLIDHENTMVGIVPTKSAKYTAESARLDLVCINQKADPPVCKILDYNKFAYEEKQRAKEAARKQRAARIETKEFQFRLSIDKHDKDVKIKNIVKHMTKGSIIRCVLQLRGRERANMPLAKERMTEILGDINTELAYESVQPMTVTGNKVIAVIKKEKS